MPTPDPSTAARDDELADEMSKESFPTSDPPASWAGPDRDPRAADDADDDRD